MRPWLLRLLTLLFACAYPIVAAWVENRSEVAFVQVARPFGAALVFAATLGALYWPLSRRSAPRTCLWLTITLLLFFSFDLLLEVFVPQLLFLGAFWGVAPNYSLRQPLALGLTAALLGAVFPLLRVRRITGERALPGLLTVTAASLGLSLLPLTQPRTTFLPEPIPAPAVTTAPYRSTTKPPKVSASPDLYCIVLDAYGRQDVLQALFGHDNEPFLQALEERGFFVARRARANYLQTPLALSAAFNLDYLPRSPTGGIEQANALLNSSRLFSILREKGYQVLSVPTNVVQTQLTIADQTFDQFVGPQAILSPLERLVLSKTPLRPLLENENAAFDEHRARLLAALESNLPAAAAVPEPKVVFAHILAPHPPFVFGPKGEPRIPKRISFTIGDASDYKRRSSPESYRQGYADQLTYLNQKVLESLDRVLAQQKRPAIYVLMGDHGSRMETDWKNLESTNLKEPFANLMAVSTPDHRAGELLGDSVSPINVFRLLLTHYYHQSFPRLPDRSYYSPLTYPYRFTDVTEKT